MTITLRHRHFQDEWTASEQDEGRLLRYVLRSSALPILLGMLNALFLSQVIFSSGSYPEFLRILTIQTLLFAIVGLLFLHRQQCFLAMVIARGAEMCRLAEMDPLTGLANRRGLEAEFARRIATGEQITLLYIDLDHFKAVNDRLGHEAGDTLLQETARRLVQACGGRAFVSRHGGDEFLVLTPHSDLDEVAEVARRIRNELMTPLAWSPDKMIKASASLGAAVRRDGSERLEDLIARADHALYAAKATAKGSCVLAT